MAQQGKGIYWELDGLQEGDFVIHKDHRGMFRTDLITSNRGHHLTIGSTRGEKTLRAAIRLAEKESRIRGLYHGIVLGPFRNNLVQIGNIVDGRWQKSGQ